MFKVSVVVPVFNSEKYIDLCLASLVNQTFPDIEIICVNDCSHDNSLKCLKDWAKKDKRIKIINFSKNRGVSVARNQGIKKANGDYVIFVDADDTIDLDFIYRLYTKITKEKSAMVCCDMKVYGKDFTNINKQYCGKNKYYFNISFGARMYKVAFLRNYDIVFPEKCIIGEDMLFVLKVLYYSPKVIHIDNTYYNYILRNDSATNKPLSKNKVENTLTAYFDFIDWLNGLNCKYFDYKYLSRKIFGYIYLLSKYDMDETTKHKICDAFLTLQDKLKYRNVLQKHKYMKMLSRMKHRDSEGIYKILFD